MPLNWINCVQMSDINFVLYRHPAASTLPLAAGFSYSNKRALHMIRSCRSARFCFLFSTQQLRYLPNAAANIILNLPCSRILQISRSHQRLANAILLCILGLLHQPRNFAFIPPSSVH